MKEEKCNCCHCDEACTCGCEEGKECTCSCDESCTCGCKDGKECTCSCDESCTCGCKDGKECTCSCDEKKQDCACEEACTCEGQECSCEAEKKTKKKKKDKHEDKLNEAYNMISLLEDKLLREKAEMINYRKRKEEETERMLKYANEDLIKEALEVVDNFERALDYDDENASEEIKKFLNGFKMIYCNLVAILEKFEVKAIDGANKPFDPTYHQAVMTDHVEGVDAGMVVDVLRKGYLLKDKVIRPAMVKVSE